MEGRRDQNLYTGPNSLVASIAYWLTSVVLDKLQTKRWLCSQCCSLRWMTLMVVSHRVKYSLNCQLTRCTDSFFSVHTVQYGTVQLSITIQYHPECLGMTAVSSLWNSLANEGIQKPHVSVAQLPSLLEVKMLHSCTNTETSVVFLHSLIGYWISQKLTTTLHHVKQC